MRLEIHPADTWADAVAADLAVTLGRPGGVRVCLPTGTTPAPVYERVPAALAERGLDAGESTVVLLDEYLGLEADDPARCDVQLGRQLIDRLDPAPSFVPIRVDDLEPDAAAAALDAEAAAGLDVAVVGLGLNGHVGMNEPGSAPNAATRAVEIEPLTARVAMGSYGARRAPSGGVTLGIGRLLEADEVWLLVSGSGKAEMLRSVLHDPMDARRPASFLRRHPALRVIADEAAAAGVAARAGNGSDRLGNTGAGEA